MVRRHQRQLGDGRESVGGDVAGEPAAGRLGIAHHPRVLHGLARLGAQPVVGIVARKEALHVLLGPVGDGGAKRLLGPRRALARGQLCVPARNQRLGLVVERAQKLALPAVPDAGPHRADVGDGEHQEQLEALRALHDVGEVAHGLGVADVAREGDPAHGQVLLDEPRGRLGLGRAEAEAGTQALCDAHSDEGMVLVAPLGDVVQERRHVERPPVLDGADDARGQGVRLAGLAALDAGEDADGADQVLVHREVVVHVELHHRHDPAEVRDEAAEHARLVHAPQRRLGVLG